MRGDDVHNRDVSQFVHREIGGFGASRRHDVQNRANAIREIQALHHPRCFPLIKIPHLHRDAEFALPTLQQRREKRQSIHGGR